MEPQFQVSTFQDMGRKIPDEVIKIEMMEVLFDTQSLEWELTFYTFHVINSIMLVYFYKLD